MSTLSSEELVYPSLISLLKIAELLTQKCKEKRVTFSREEFEKMIRRIVVEYSSEAWKEEKLPLYIFKTKWESPELTRDLQILFERPFLRLRSDAVLTEDAESFLKSYEKLNLFSEYRLKALEKIIDKLLKQSKKC